MARLIGIDPGLAVTGWGIVEAGRGGCGHLAHGVIRTRKKDGLAARLLRIRDDVASLVREWNVAGGAIEEAFVGVNASSALALGQARAAAIIGLAQSGLPVAGYSPNLVKQTVSGYGHGEKGQIALMVRLQLGLDDEPRPADAADALAVALTHWAHWRFEDR
ncbi:MAG: crossover junction endodeoxyribonuclease RuvC [Dehalococcoidia bacterium]